APGIPCGARDIETIKSFLTTLPFSLTPSQKRSAWEIMQNMAKPSPMNRLLEGDVGSGKTVVAAIAALHAATHGFQTALMAPTEVLAQQHFATFMQLFANTRATVGLLTAHDAKIFDAELKTAYTVKKKEFHNFLKDGKLSVVVGTHALIASGVAFKNMGLVILDEQHRFGVSQRAALAAQNGAKLTPHFLSMTATPIPRTLSLTIYGDLDVSLLNEMPKNRKKIITRLVLPHERNTAYDFIRREVRAGRQVFVICPRIEPSQRPEDEQKTAASFVRNRWNDTKAVKEEYEKLHKTIFPDLRVAMLHGKLKAKEKEQVMREFKEGTTNILVSTSVVEVGVDVPNATVMMIEGAERFGLAQLHQFRGRVGRAHHQSYCLLFSEHDIPSENRRLKALAECDNGFELAEKDLAIRGPGDFFGGRQSGFPDLTMASLTDLPLIKVAREEAARLLAKDPILSAHHKIKQRVADFRARVHLE
ncbi:MAG: ATP-dependent DNA helicase RecG, partial [Patescibacteria group bacterium]